MNVQSSSATNLHKKDLRHFLNMNQFSKKEILEWIELMKLLKDARTRNAVPQLFKNQSLGMIFQQNSTRTRVSFETAATLLGGHALMLGAGDIHLGKKETVEDTARVLARMVDVIMIRTDKYADIERFAEYSSIPIINAMSTDVHGDDTGNHPTQCLADLLTMEEHLPPRQKARRCDDGGGGRSLDARSVARLRAFQTWGHFQNHFSRGLSSAAERG
ncbi:hypothetical protein [Adlercreutzia sp.]|uniref:hypothetical protein n=1 Tax=Adlercreutzia sp. TaxID=1872387 RepID=UPI003AEF43F6